MQAAYSVEELYDRYAGMLLGYITDIVKDKKVAEEQLISIFSGLHANLHKINTDDCNAWCRLQRFALEKLRYNDTGRINETKASGPDLLPRNTSKEFFDLMTDEQQHVFYQVYSRAKSVAQLSAETGKTETSICKILKEAFTIIRKVS